MANPREPVPLTLEQRRDRTIETLVRHVAQETLTLEEFEQRVDGAHRARSAVELDSLVRDLPALAQPAGRAPASPPAARSAVYTGERRGQQHVIAILGGATRRGPWVPGRRISVLALMGGAVLDFREARIGPGITEVTILAFMGGVDVILPPGLAVESGGIALMGGFEHLDQLATTRDPDAPVLRINGFAFMGGVQVDVRLPGETERDARRRRREERRQIAKQRRRPGAGSTGE